MATISLALAGDTMLGRGVAQRLQSGAAPESLVAPDLAQVMRDADLTILNLECCISDRGEPWPDPRKPFFFRAQPASVATLTHVGVDCVTLANNHALDFGAVALTDTLDHLERAGIAVVGAGATEVDARRAVILERRGVRLGIIGVTDHPADYAAGPSTPGVAYANLRRGLPDWLRGLVRETADACDALLVTPHWGPNMVDEPLPELRRAAEALCDAGATLVAGHSAHVFHGVSGHALHDLGDFLDDYAVDGRLRNDLGLLWLVTLSTDGPIRLEALPIALDFCYTRFCDAAEAEWIRHRFRRACAALGTDVTEQDGRLVVQLR